MQYYILAFRCFLGEERQAEVFPGLQPQQGFHSLA